MSGTNMSGLFNVFKNVASYLKKSASFSPSSGLVTIMSDVSEPHEIVSPLISVDDVINATEPYIMPSTQLMMKAAEPVYTVAIQEKEKQEPVYAPVVSAAPTKLIIPHESTDTVDSTMEEFLSLLPLGGLSLLAFLL